MALLQTLSHVNIIEYIDSFICGKELVIVLEWADAGDLKRQIRLARQRQLRFEERLVWKYTAQIASAVQHMHERRIIHRDLKPANIFLTSQGVVKVGDLGLSRFMSETTLEAFSKVGTPLYMAPEVLKGHGYDFKSDVWSLGCILYELAMLKSPFKEKGIALMDLFHKIDKAVFTPVPVQISKPIAKLTKAMISKDVASRPSIHQVCQMSEQIRLEMGRKPLLPDSAQLALELESTFHRLSLLGYQRRFEKTMTPLYFAARWPSSKQLPNTKQFDEFVALCSWLLSLLDVAFSPSPEMSQHVVATQLSNCAAQCLASEEIKLISPVQLSAGYGPWRMRSPLEALVASFAGNEV